MNMTRDVAVTLALLLVELMLVSAASAATEEVQVIRYADNNYRLSKVLHPELDRMQSSMTHADASALSNAGADFDYADPYGNGRQNMFL
jgi:hypothetical protein